MESLRRHRRSKVANPTALTSPAAPQVATNGAMIDLQS